MSATADTFTVNTAEGWTMVFSTLDASTCQVGYLDADGSQNKMAVDRNVVNGQVTIPSTANGYTVTKIGKYALKDITNMTAVIIPETVTTIEMYGLEGCRNLQSLHIPASVTSIGSMALANLVSLETITVDSNNQTFSSPAGSNAIIQGNVLVNGCKNTTIPSTITELGAYAFYGCVLPTLIIPSSVTSIGDDTFARCTLTDVYCNAKIVPTSNADAFRDSNFRNANLYVPAGSKSTYEAADYWKEFKTIEEKTLINVVTAGTLSTLISAEDKNTIQNLKINGQLNGEDLRFLREMAGSDYNGVPTDGSLKKLDLSGTSIVDGGTYVELVDGCIYYDKGKTMMSGGFANTPQPSKANTLGENVFAGCFKLEEIILPINLVDIGKRAFMYSPLSKITWSNSLASIGDYAFGFCDFTTFSLPNSVTSLGYFVFEGCNSLTSLRVETGNTVYDSRNNCNAIIENATNRLVCGINTTEIPATVTSIGRGAFSMINIKSISLPSGLEAISQEAFNSCYNLVFISIPSSVTTLYSRSFAYCNNIASIIVESGNAKYDSRKNCNAVIETSSKTLIKGCKNTVIPYGVKIIDEYAYQGCSGMSEITIPGSVTTIGDYSFKCSLQTVKVENPTPIAISNSVFDNVNNIDLIVPVGSISAYKAADNWKDFKTIKDTEGNTEDASVPEGSVTITMSSNNTWMGYSCNANLDFTNVEGVKAYIAAGYVETIVWMMRARVVPANTGVVLISDTPGATFEVPTTTRTGIYTNYFVPIVNRQTIYPTQEIDGIDYTYFAVGILSSTGKPGFVYVPSTMQYGPNRSLVKIPTSDIPSSALSRGMTAVFDDGTTFIDDLTIKEEDDDDLEWYTLSGVRIHKPTKKGIYLHKGKKVLIK